MTTVLLTGASATFIPPKDDNAPPSLCPPPGAFSSQYNTVDLLYFERHPSSTAAIEREKQLKA